MPRNRYTILILPHAESRLRKIHVSRGFLVTAAVIVAMVLLTGLAIPHLAFKTKSQAALIDVLHQKNNQLLAEKRRFEDSLDNLTAQIGGYEKRTGQLAMELGIEEQLPSSRPAAGGSSAPLAGAPQRLQQILDKDMDVLESRSSGLNGSLDMLDQAWAERLRMLACTPSVMPVRGFYSHGYGWRKDPFTGERDFHHGVDIVADRGTPVHASADGVITRATRYQDYGKMVQVSHGFGLATRYGHLNEILVKPGQKVRRGDVIGRVGSTGRSTGPHLHYEVFKAGRRVDPRKYMGDKSF